MSLKVKIEFFKFVFSKDWKVIDILSFCDDWNYGSLFMLSKDEEFFDWDILFIGAILRWIRRKKK